MNIGIDARMYGHHTRGIGRYIQEIITQIEKIDTQNTYTIFLSEKNYHEYVPQNNKFKKVLVPWKWYSIQEQLFFSTFIKKHSVDLMHFPHFNVPIFYNAPFVVTIHDLILLRASQKRATTLGPFKYYIKKFFFKFVLSHAIKKAQKIIALTDFGKEDILSEYKIDSNKISVIPHGVTTVKTPPTKIDTLSELGYNINKPYIMYVGSAYPHKNLKNLIFACDIVCKKLDIQLIFVGKKDFFYQRQEQEYARDYIIYTDYISDEKLAQLYSHAHAYVFPSLYEGFGLPPLEAMTYECPVISSNRSCLPEVLQDAALYITPQDPDDIAQAIFTLFENSDIRNELIHNGLKITKQLNWKIAAQKTHDVYTNIPHA